MREPTLREELQICFEEAVRVIEAATHVEYVVHVKKHEGGVVIESGPIRKTRVRAEQKNRGA